MTKKKKRDKSWYVGGYNPTFDWRYPPFIPAAPGQTQPFPPGVPLGPGGIPGPGGFPGPGGIGQPQPGTPPTPAPSYKPAKSQATPYIQPGTQAQQPGGPLALVYGGDLRPCLYRWVYLWQDNGDEYWIYLTSVRRRSAAGYRWTGFGYVYFGVDLRRVDAFYCV